MNKISKPFFLSMMIILISIGIIYLLNSGTSAFEDAHKDAQQRVQHIQKEIVHAQDIIQQTKFQLDSMEEHVNKLQAEQARIIRIYNPSNPEITYRLAAEREKLNHLKKEYNATEQEKRTLEIRLDSLSTYIQKNF